MSKEYAPRYNMKTRSPKGVEEAAQRRRLLDSFFFVFGLDGPSGWVVRCQICGGALQRDEADGCHKVRASQRGPSEAQNLVAAHGFRSRRQCHRWADAKAARYHHLRDSPASLENGEVVRWSPEHEAALRRYLLTGMDKFSDP